MYYILRKWIPILYLSVQWIPHKLIWFTNLLILIYKRSESRLKLLFSSDLYLIFMKVFKINYWPNLWQHKSFWFLCVLNSQLIIKNDLLDKYFIETDILCFIHRKSETQMQEIETKEEKIGPPIRRLSSPINTTNSSTTNSKSSEESLNKDKQYLRKVGKYLTELNQRIRKNCSAHITPDGRIFYQK